MTITLSTGETLEGDLILAAVGRVPNTAGVNLEEVGVEVADGFISTDEQLRTSLPSVFAVGDVSADFSWPTVDSSPASSLPRLSPGSIPSPLTRPASHALPTRHLKSHRWAYQRWQHDATSATTAG